MTKYILFFVMVMGPASLVKADNIIASLQMLADNAVQANNQAVAGQDGWLFFAPELRHLAAGPFWGEAAEKASRASRPDAKDPLPAILDFYRQLKERGVRLILVPVPPKALVYSDKLPDQTTPLPRFDVHHQEFYDLLRAEGIEVLDLADEFIAQRDHENGPMFCRQDTHWSGAGCVVAAETVAKQLALEIDPRAAYTAEWRLTEINGDLRQMRNDETLPPETLALRAISHNGEPIASSPDSPVVVLGDSHGLVFHAGGDMHYRGAGFADQLAYALGAPVEVIAVRGSGATPARINLFRRAQRDPAYWSGKKAVVWVFSAREFTESDGWRIVPVAP
jgi:alginate O-acetyltransferase complex protein AlgJ